MSLLYWRMNLLVYLLLPVLPVRSSPVSQPVKRDDVNIFMPGAVPTSAITVNPPAPPMPGAATENSSSANQKIRRADATTRKLKFGNFVWELVDPECDTTPIEKYWFIGDSQPPANTTYAVVVKDLEINFKNEDETHALGENAAKALQKGLFNSAETYTLGLNTIFDFPPQSDKYNPPSAPPKAPFDNYNFLGNFDAPKDTYLKMFGFDGTNAMHYAVKNLQASPSTSSSNPSNLAIGAAALVLCGQMITALTDYLDSFYRWYVKYSFDYNEAIIAWSGISVMRNLYNLAIYTIRADSNGNQGKIPLPDHDQVANALSLLREGSLGARNSQWFSWSVLDTYQKDEKSPWCK